MKLIASSYAGREDEQAAADMLDMTIPGERYSHSKRDINKYNKRTLGAVAEVHEKFFDWMRDPSAAHWEIGSRSRIAGVARAALREDMRLRRRLAYDTIPTSIRVLPYETIEGLERAADWRSAERDCEVECENALGMIEVIARGGIKRSGSLLLGDVVWGAVMALSERAHKFQLHVECGGHAAGINNVRDEFGLAPFGRPKPRPPIVHAYIQRVAAREQIANASLALTLIQLKIADF
jgi:hypothetical protein